MHEISGGEKQRVILARALAQQPLLLLLDEPTLHLDIGAQVELLERLRHLASENRYTVVVVTHELSLAAEFADQVVLMHKGKCLRVGTPAEVYRRDLLEQVFEAPLDVDMGPEGRPRVHIRGRETARMKLSKRFFNFVVADFSAALEQYEISLRRCIHQPRTPRTGRRCKLRRRRATVRRLFGEPRHCSHR